MTVWKIGFSIFAFFIEYVVTIVWCAKIGKIKDSFSGSIFLVAFMEIIVVWSTLWITLDDTENYNAALVCLISVTCMLIFNIIQFMAGEQDLRKQSELVKARILKEQLANQNSRKSELEEHINKANEAKA